MAQIFGAKVPKGKFDPFGGVPPGTRHLSGIFLCRALWRSTHPTPGWRVPPGLPYSPDPAQFWSRLALDLGVWRPCPPPRGVGSQVRRLPPFAVAALEERRPERATFQAVVNLALFHSHARASEIGQCCCVLLFPHNAIRIHPQAEF